MDRSRMGRGHSITAIGGGVLVISLFISWAAGQDAFQAFSVVDILMLIIGIAALAYGLAPAFGAEAQLPPSAPWVVAALGAASFGWAMGFEFEVSGDFGVWLAVLASIAIGYGAYEAAGSRSLAPTAGA